MSHKYERSRRDFVKSAGIGSALTILPGMLWVLPESDVKLFLGACRAGELEVVRKILAADKSLLSATDNQGRSGFTLAKLQGHHLVADHLKEQGYETTIHEAALDLDWDRLESLLGEENIHTKTMVNEPKPIGGTAIWAAAAGGAGQDMWRLYAKCANPNIVARQSTSPLEAALLVKDLATAEITAAALLSNHADPDPDGKGRDAPIHIAASRGSEEMVELIIRLGADVHRVNSEGKSAHQIALDSGHNSIARLIENQNKIPRTCSSSRMAYTATGDTYSVPLMDDIPLYLLRRLVGQAHGNLDYVKNEVKADPRLAHSQATTSEICVEACAHIGRKRIVDFLLKNGAPYSINTAVMMGDISTVKKYLAEDPERIHERGAHHFALLWYPIIGRCSVDMLELLLAAGAQVEDQHFLGTTALHWACQRDQLEMVVSLVENGADVNRVGRKFKPEGERPLQMARDEKIVQYLKSKGAS